MSNLTFLCLSNEFKGQDFLKYCKKEGNKVILITSKKFEHANWPWDSIDEFYVMDATERGDWDMNHLTLGVAHLRKSQKIDRIIALDDFDVEKAAHLRETFRIPGMGQTTHRYFRDKLAMRIKAKESGILVPPFSALFNDEEINQFAATVAPPWVVKPRGEASATGIKKVHTAEELWEVVHGLGENRIQYLVEQFKPGDVYHVDSLSLDGKLLFSRVSKYLNTPFEVAHGGGIFRSAICEFGGEADTQLRKLTGEVMQAFGMQFSASHTEFIRSYDDGGYYFLETSSRVGGAHLAEMVEFSSGINLWGEWARVETAKAKGEEYQLPEIHNQYAGIVVSLCRFEKPDMSGFDDPEVYWKIDKDHHIGMIVVSDDPNRVLSLLDDYAQRIHEGFHAVLPAK